MALGAARIPEEGALPALTPRGRIEGGAPRRGAVRAQLERAGKETSCSLDFAGTWMEDLGSDGQSGSWEGFLDQD